MPPQRRPSPGSSAAHRVGELQVRPPPPRAPLSCPRAADSLVRADTAPPSPAASATSHPYPPLLARAQLPASASSSALSAPAAQRSSLDPTPTSSSYQRPYVDEPPPSSTRTPHAGGDNPFATAPASSQRSLRSQRSSVGDESVFGTAPVGIVGKTRPREVIRVERDYSAGETCQMWSGWLWELENRVRSSLSSRRLSWTSLARADALQPRRSRRPTTRTRSTRSTRSSPRRTTPLGPSSTTASPSSRSTSRRSSSRRTTTGSVVSPLALSLSTRTDPGRPLGRRRCAACTRSSSGSTATCSTRPGSTSSRRCTAPSSLCVHHFSSRAPSSPRPLSLCRRAGLLRAGASERGRGSEVRRAATCARGRLVPSGPADSHACAVDRAANTSRAASSLRPVGLLLTVPPLALSLLAARWQLHAARDRVLLIGASAKV